MNIEELITKYLTNESTSEENATLLEWVISNPENKKEFISICQIWQNASLINSKFNNKKAYQSFVDSTKTIKIQNTNKPKTIALWKKLSAIAAVAILTIGMFFMFKPSDSKLLTFSNTNVALKAIQLADGSEIFLQKGSSISYPEAFEKNARNISVKGNVFCKIARNEKSPFIISSKTIAVEVLGTSFEVNAEQNNVHVIVASGKVKVSQNNSNNQVIITKGQRADIKNNNLVKSENSDINYLSWKTGTLYFNNTSLKTVFTDLERHFSCTFIIKNKEIFSETMTGTYQNFTLSQTIEMINSAFPQLLFEQVNSSKFKVSLKN